MTRPLRCIPFVLIVAAFAPPVRADDAAPTRLLRARDTLDLHIADESNAAAREMLTALAWEPTAFRFTVAAPNDLDRYPTDAERLIRFPSARPNADEPDMFNTALVEWWPAVDEAGKPLEKAPAILFLHILDNRMTISRALGRTLSKRGIHCFLLHAPGFGRRRTGPFNAADFFKNSAQAVSDARRARDVIAALDTVKADRIALAGTSLGGFLAGPAAGLDDAFDRVFIMLAGGDLHHMFTHGVNEAAKVRDHLEAAGFTGPSLVDICKRIEPTTLAHRIDPKRAWMVNTLADQVVPRHCCDRLAAAIGLPPERHLMVTGDHYLGVVHMPWIADFLERNVTE